MNPLNVLWKIMDVAGQTNDTNQFETSLSASVNRTLVHHTVLSCERVESGHKSDTSCIY